MRIALVSWNRQKLGGTEVYLDQIISSLHQQGHEVAFWHEVDEPKAAGQIAVPQTAPTWCVSELSEREALKGLRNWAPDVIYAHGLTNPGLESEVLKIAPAVFFAHSYYGTCISGGKSFAFPKVYPCTRSFGPQCLLHYYPHRCGGLNPLTMWRDYHRQRSRLELLSRYKAIVTMSAYMVKEYVNHGFDPNRLHNLSGYFGANGTNEERVMRLETLRPGQGDAADAAPEIRGPLENDFHHLLFLGRMDYLKGGRVLCASLPHVCAALNRPVLVTFAGDGPDRKVWEKQAARLQTLHDNLRIEFTGWVSPQRRDELLQRCHLLVVPSLWPEPFGLVGLEASSHGVPAVAFDVGGIKEWLWHGTNGFLASGNPATPERLAAAIVKCFETPTAYARLRRGAFAVGQVFSRRRHVHDLLTILRRAATDSYR